MAGKSEYIIRLTELAQQLNTGNWEIPAEVDLSSDRAVTWFSQTLPSIGFSGYTEPGLYASAKHGGIAAVNALEYAIDWSTGDMRVNLTPEDIAKAGEVIAKNDTQTWFRLSVLTDIIDATIAYFSNTNTSFSDHLAMAAERREARENYLDLKKEGLAEAEVVLLTGVRYENGKAVYSHAPLYLSAQDRAKYNDYLGNNNLLNTTAAETVLEGHDIVSSGVALGLVGLASRLPIVKPVLNTAASAMARGSATLAERIVATVQSAQQAGKGVAAASTTRVSPVLAPNGQNVIAAAPQGSAAVKALQLNSRGAVLGAGALRFMGAAGGAYFIVTGGKDTIDSYMDCRYGSAGFGAFVTAGRVAYTGMAVATPATSGASAIGAGITMVGVEGTKIVVNDVLKITDIEGDEASKAIAKLMENDFVNPATHYRLTNIEVLRAVRGASDADPVYVYLKEKYGADDLQLIQKDIIIKSKKETHPRRGGTGFAPFGDYSLPSSVIDKQFLKIFSTSDVLAQSDGYRQFMLGELKYVNVMDGGVTFQGYRTIDVLRDLGTMWDPTDNPNKAARRVDGGKDGILVHSLRSKGFTDKDILLLQNEADRQINIFQKELLERSEEALDYRFRFNNPEFYNSLSDQAKKAFKPDDFLPLPSDQEVSAYLHHYTAEFSRIEQKHKERYGSCERKDPPPTHEVPGPEVKRGDRARKSYSALNLPPEEVVAMLDKHALTDLRFPDLFPTRKEAGSKVSDARYEFANADGSTRLSPSTVSGGAYTAEPISVG